MKFITTLFIATLVFSSCSGSTSDSKDGTVPNVYSNETKPSSDNIQDGELVVRPDNNDGANNGVWIGVNYMDDSEVTLAWDASFDADTKFSVYRITSLGNDPQKVELTSDKLIYSGIQKAYTDTEIGPDTFYTYILEAEIDDEIKPRRWADALTTTDVTPPEKITGLVGNRNSNGIKLEWERSSDNVEFGSYSVSVFEDSSGENETTEPTYIGGGADIEQTSFLDNKAPENPVIYQVLAVDFHGNKSDPTTIEIK